MDTCAGDILLCVACYLSVDTLVQWSRTAWRYRLLLQPLLQDYALLPAPKRYQLLERAEKDGQIRYLLYYAFLKEEKRCFQWVLRCIARIGTIGDLALLLYMLGEQQSHFYTIIGKYLGQYDNSKVIEQLPVVVQVLQPWDGLSAGESLHIILCAAIREAMQCGNQDTYQAAKSHLVVSGGFQNCLRAAGKAFAIRFREWLDAIIEDGSPILPWLADEAKTVLFTAPRRARLSDTVAIRIALGKNVNCKNFKYLCERLERVAITYHNHDVLDQLLSRQNCRRSAIGIGTITLACVKAGENPRLYRHWFPSEEDFCRVVLQQAIKYERMDIFQKFRHQHAHCALECACAALNKRNDLLADHFVKFLLPLEEETARKLFGSCQSIDWARYFCQYFEPSLDDYHAWLRQYEDNDEMAALFVVEQCGCPEPTEKKQCHWGTYYVREGVRRPGISDYDWEQSYIASALYRYGLVRPQKRRECIVLP